MNHCSGLGVCKNGKCICDSGNSDPDCGGGDIGEGVDRRRLLYKEACVPGVLGDHDRWRQLNIESMAGARSIPTLTGIEEERELNGLHLLSV